MKTTLTTVEKKGENNNNYLIMELEKAVGKSEAETLELTYP